MHDTPEVYIGVDTGETKVAAGLVDTSSMILYKTRNPMQVRGTAAEGLTSVRTAIDTALRENPEATVRCIGLISPRSPAYPRKSCSYRHIWRFSRPPRKHQQQP